MSESTVVTNIISRSSKVNEIWDSVDPSLLCKIKNKKNWRRDFSFCSLSTDIQGHSTSWAYLCFHRNLQKLLLLLQSENYSVYCRNSDISSDQKRSQIDRTHVKTVSTLANGFATRNLKSLFLLSRCTFK